MLHPLLRSEVDSTLDILRGFLQRTDLDETLRAAFGADVDVQAASSLLHTLVDGDLPRISLVPALSLNGAWGAFSEVTNSIFLSNSLVRRAASDKTPLVSVLLEEIGHYVDARVNATDAPGDEGEIFARLVQGEQLSSVALASLRAQNDFATVSLGGVSQVVEMATQFGTLTLDGNLVDWTPADRLEVPGSGVDGYQLYGRYAADTFVFALSAPVAIGPSTTFWLNTDRNVSTGHQIFGFAGGAEYNINFDATGTPRLYTGADGQTLVAGAVVDVMFNANRTVVEFAVASAAVGASQGLDVYVDVNDTTFLPTSYANYTYSVLAPLNVPPVSVGSVTLDGSLADWTAGDRIDTVLSTSGYEIYGKFTGDNYVIAMKAPMALGANTTMWINADRNAATGFQIFGFAGGAEYNVDIDGTGNARLFTGGAGQTAVANGDITERYSTDRTVIELAIPKELIGFAGAPATINTLFDVNNSVFLPSSYAAAQYTIAPPTAPVIGTVTFDGNLSDWTAADRIDGVAPVANYEVYSRVSGDSFVFAMRSLDGTAIGPNTTTWLNTDQNISTGFQIFGSAGGAEFNINFDAAGVPFLYSGDAGQTAVGTSPLVYGRSANGSTIEFAVAKSAIGSPAAIDTLFDVNNQNFLPGSYSGPQYTVFDTSNLPARTDAAKKVAIVYSESTAARYFGDPALPGQLAINQTAYSQLFMAAQNQAAVAGVPFDILTESDLTDLAKLVNYDAIVFPSFQFVDSTKAVSIENNLKVLAQNYDTSLIAAGNFMTANQNGTLLPGDPYARMKALFDLAPDGGGTAASIAIASAGTGFDGVGGYTAGEAIATYTNTGHLKFVDTTPGVTPLTVIDNQTVDGVTSAAVVISSASGDRNVHFSTEALLGDNNQLWQSIQYAVNGATGPTIGLQIGRQAAIVASRNDMDQSQQFFDVDPDGATPGIYDVLLPILAQWKTDYNFVGSYYVNIGNAPPDEQTNWDVSLRLYQQFLAMGNEIGTHSYTHPVDTNLLTPAQIENEFNQSSLELAQRLGVAIAGAAVPGAPERLATSTEILQYVDYLTGGYTGVGAGYPGAIGYILPGIQDKVYIAPNATFDFTLNEFRNLTPAQADAFWAQEWETLTGNSDLPVVVWPWHDYGPTEWLLDPPAASPYDISQFTNYISRAAAAGSEFVTLADLAQRVESFEKAAVTSTVSGNVVTATVVSSDAGKFALDLDNLGGQVIAGVAGWYAYDDDSVFTDRDGGTFAITLGAVASDVTRITALPMRSELVSLSGDGTDLSFSLQGEGRVVIDLKNIAGAAVAVTGATVVSQVGDILTLDVGAFGQHSVFVDLDAPNSAPVISSNGGGAAAAVSYAENGTGAITTVSATDANASQSITFSIDGGVDAALFAVNPLSGALNFISAPDFETPADAGGNNVYDVVVKATDNGSPALSDTQSLAITVTNVNGVNRNGTILADTLNGTPEAEQLSGGADNDILNGFGGNDTLIGGTGDDAAFGGAGNDSMTGGAGSDTLDGGAGADRIIGGAGADVMIGGADADTFIFTAANQSFSGAIRDRVTDFTPGIDKIDVGLFDANTSAAGIQDFAFLSAPGASITAAGQLRFRHDVANDQTFVEGNTNTNLTTLEFQIVLSGIQNLTLSDFII